MRKKTIDSGKNLRTTDKHSFKAYTYCPLVWCRCMAAPWDTGLGWIWIRPGRQLWRSLSACWRRRLIVWPRQPGHLYGRHHPRQWTLRGSRATVVGRRPSRCIPDVRKRWQEWETIIGVGISGYDIKNWNETKNPLLDDSWLEVSEAEARPPFSDS